mmetsp:Transcript_19966/g.38510  ORF Transcript_19966/g.38510 Transcript_19966/m.38510 type:complete len:214 (+) Transcript_19966:1349-1990(+)
MGLDAHLLELRRGPYRVHVEFVLHPPDAARAAGALRRVPARVLADHLLRLGHRQQPKEPVQDAAEGNVQREAVVCDAPIALGYPGEPHCDSDQARQSPPRQWVVRPIPNEENPLPHGHPFRPRMGLGSRDAELPPLLLPVLLLLVHRAPGNQGQRALRKEVRRRLGAILQPCPLRFDSRRVVEVGGSEAARSEFDCLSRYRQKLTLKVRLCRS